MVKQANLEAKDILNRIRSTEQMNVLEMIAFVMSIWDNKQIKDKEKILEKSSCLLTKGEFEHYWWKFEFENELWIFE